MKHFPFNSKTIVIQIKTVLLSFPDLITYHLAINKDLTWILFKYIIVMAQIAIKILSTMQVHKLIIRLSMVIIWALIMPKMEVPAIYKQVEWQIIVNKNLFKEVKISKLHLRMLMKMRVHRILTLKTHRT